MVTIRMNVIRSVASIDISKRSYIKTKEFYFLALSVLASTETYRISRIRKDHVKLMGPSKVSLVSRCLLTGRALNRSSKYKMTRMMYKFMLNTSKINGVRVTKR